MTTKRLPRVALLHYSAPPVIGGVENVILAHTRLLAEAGYPVTVLAGRGGREALPPGVGWVQVPEMDSQHREIVDIGRALEQGRLPARFEAVADRLGETLGARLASIDVLVVHNVLTKHFNLPLTAALVRLLDEGRVQSCIAWCHDITWTSPGSRSKVHPGYPWDLLRSYRSDVSYVTVSEERRQELAGLYGCPEEQIQVIYNGVDPGEILGLSGAGLALIDRLGLWESDLNLLMPVRVTRAKNIELALDVVAALKEQGMRPKLVVTGPPDPHDPKSMEYFRQLLALREEKGLVQQVHFVYESGPDPSGPFLVEMPVVADLLRASDVLFMPSRREGFGMPVLEAGLAGVPVFCAAEVPAAREIGGQDVFTFPAGASPDQVARLIHDAVRDSSSLRLRRRVRQALTWNSLFHRQIAPLLAGSGE